MLAASLHSTHERGERQFLFEHLDRLSAGDLLLLDRGYPCRWLVAVLNQRSINFCMRVDNSDTSFTCVRQLLRSGERERRPCLSNCPGSGLSFHQRDIEFLRQYRELLICLIIAEQ